MIKIIRVGVPLLVAIGFALPLLVPVNSEAFMWSCYAGTAAAFALIGMILVAHYRRK